jgi:uncharacterized membrane protein YkoI
LRNGDEIVIAKNGDEETVKVTKAQKHKAVAKGRRGQTATVTLGEENGKAVFRVDVKETDGEGRVRLDD